VLASVAGIWLKRVLLMLLETNGYNVEREVIPLVKREGFYFRKYRNIWYYYNIQQSQMRSA
jgi:hypothetical protein